MRTIFSNWALFSVVVFAFLASTVRSEYTWNGAEWVWTDNKNPQQPPQSLDYEEEGSGGGGRDGGRDGGYVEEDDDDTGFEDDYDYNEGSGSMSSNNDNWDSNNNNNRGRGNSYSQNNQDQMNNNNNNQMSRNNNNNYQDPYNTNVDPYDSNSRNGGVDRSQNNLYSTQPPYFGSEVEKTDDIYVDPPGMFPSSTTTSTAMPPRDPSISSRPKNTNRTTSFFAQPGTLAAVIGGAVVGLLCAILCVMFVVYRMRKKDEGSYALDEPKRSPTVNAYAKHPSREFYA